MNDVVIFFDLFDTLIKINRGYLEEYFDDEIDLLGDKGILRNSEMTISKLINKHPEVLNKYSSKEMTNFYNSIMSNSLINVDNSVINLLKTIKELGFKLCIISDATFVDIKNFKNSPLYKYFDNAIFSCNYGYTKPDAKLYTIAKKVMGNPKKCIFIGDGGHQELIGAKNVGMNTIKVEWYKKVDNYNQVDFCTDEPKELLNKIKECL